MQSADLRLGDGDGFQDHASTLWPPKEPWRLTPSLMETNSFPPNNTANTPLGYYTPTPDGRNTVFYPYYVDIHTPISMAAPGPGTPLSMPASGTIHTGDGIVHMGGFQPLPQHQMHHFNPFMQEPPPQKAFAPSNFVDQDTGYETREQDSSPRRQNRLDDRRISADPAMHIVTPTMHLQQGLPSHQLLLSASAEKIRFYSTLNAPTAMIKQSDEIPVTYLNKGQAYSLSIADTYNTIPIAPGTKFRTFVRISLEHEERRSQPGVCWSLWKEGRGVNEAHQRGGRLQAVEYVEPDQPVEGDDERTRVELEISSFDGFSVTWTPGLLGVPKVNLPVRFNFLSTDFSHSKGVKGIPVRLCAKTNLIADSPQSFANVNPEICFCKVKLFRDHGAERKLSNDVIHVKKSIEKLEQQITQAESGMKDFGKRKRRNDKPKMIPNRAGKVPKHKRTWSLSSPISAEGSGATRTTADDDLYIKLHTLHDMLTSTRSFSVLYLRGGDQDDPDAHPVALAGDVADAELESARKETNWTDREKQVSNAGSMVSSCPSSPPFPSQQSVVGFSGPWNNLEGQKTSKKVQKPTDEPTKVQKTSEAGKVSGWIEVLGVDQTYQPPPERMPKPVACFYLLRRDKNEAFKRKYHTAVYLFQRSLMDFNRRVAKRFELDPAKIQRTIHVLPSGLEMTIDDDIVQNMGEAQEMILQVERLEQPVKQEWEIAVDGTPTQVTPQPSAAGFILRVIF